MKGDIPTESQWNAPGLALKGLGLTDDNSGKPSMPISLDFPVPVRLGAVNEQAKAVSGSTYTVPAGKLFIVRAYHHAGSVTDSITPSGGVAHSLAAGAGIVWQRAVCWALGAGDAVTMGAGSYCAGILMDLPTGWATLCTVITNTTTYTVAAARRLVLLSATGSNANQALLTIDGTNAVDALGQEVATGLGADVPTAPALLLTAAQVLASSSTLAILVTGIVLNVT